MSLVPGVSGQASQFIDGLKVNTISELTTGSKVSFPNGVLISSRSDGSSVPSGSIGEYRQAANTNATVGTGSSYNVITSLLLDAGIWDISAMLSGGDQSQPFSFAYGGIFISTSNSSPFPDLLMGLNQCNFGAGASWGGNHACIPRYVVNITTATTYYFLGSGDHQVTGLKGYIHAIRIG